MVTEGHVNPIGGVMPRFRTGAGSQIWGLDPGWDLPAPACRAGVAGWAWRAGWGGALAGVAGRAPGWIRQDQDQGPAWRPGPVKQGLPAPSHPRLTRTLTPRPTHTLTPTPSRPGAPHPHTQEPHRGAHGSRRGCNRSSRAAEEASARGFRLSRLSMRATFDARDLRLFCRR